MMRLCFAIVGLSALVGLSACHAIAPGYTAPEKDGLIAVRPYPGPNDVCRIIGESPQTVDLLDDAALLVGCPLNEAGAIKDMQLAGGVPIRAEGRWMLFSIRLR